MAATAEVKVTLFADEYWEARGHDLAEQVATWITAYYGERCPERAENCVLCQQWEAFDKLFGEEAS